MGYHLLHPYGSKLGAGWVLGVMLISCARCSLILTPESLTGCLRKQEGLDELPTGRPSLSLCTNITGAFSSSAGLLSNGSCAYCGVHISAVMPCPKDAPAVQYVRNGKRYCGCNIGYNGNGLATNCKACPAGTTTQGYGATSAADCSVCAIGFTGKPPNCKHCSTLFKGSITTARAGTNQQCVCPTGYTGKPGQCKACPGYGATTRGPGSDECVCPAGGKPPFCKPCEKAGGVILKGKCACPAPFTGSWPNCASCPESMGQSTSTRQAGNGQRCECDLGVAARYDPVTMLTKDARTGACICNAEAGYYPQVLESQAWNGPRCSTLSPRGSKLVTVDGRTWLGCDAAKGWGANLVTRLGYGGPYCIQCNMTGAYIDKESSKCKCKSGYSLNPEFGVEGADPAAAYCVKCQGSSHVAGTMPFAHLRDKYCRCDWEGGYANNNTGGVPERACYLCKGSTLQVSMTNGNCDCAEGLQQDGYNFDTMKPECVATSCPAGFEPERSQCICKYANPDFEDVGQDDIPRAEPCVYPGLGCRDFNISYWTGVDPRLSAKRLTRVMAGKPSGSLKIRAAATINKTSNLLSLLPSGVARKGLAMRVSGCVCALDPAISTLQMTSTGSAVLNTFERRAGNDCYWCFRSGLALDQSAVHTSQQASYYAFRHFGSEWPVTRCMPFNLLFASGTNSKAQVGLRWLVHPWNNFQINLFQEVVG